MVEIVEETAENTGGAGPSTSSSGPGASVPTTSVIDYIKANMLDSALNATRFATVFFSICYMLPFLSPIHPESAYYKAFAAAAASSAMRLQQRVGPVSLSREFFYNVIREDSCHYLFYTVLFLTSAPVTMALLPIGLYAILHSANFLVKVMRSTGRGASPMCAALANRLQEQTANCLGIIACAEIFLIPILISMIFVGRSSLLIPFVYYRFLTLRYTSVRNPYTRQAMSQMRYSLEQISSSPSCPTVVRRLVSGSIAFICRLAPQAV